MHDTNNNNVFASFWCNKASFDEPQICWAFGTIKAMNRPFYHALDFGHLNFN